MVYRSAKCTHLTLTITCEIIKFYFDTYISVWFYFYRYLQNVCVQFYLADKCDINS